MIGCTVDELGHRMSAQEFGRWLAFLKEEPTLPVHGLARHAAVMAAITNGPLTKRDESMWVPGDFQVEPWAEQARHESQREPTYEEIQAAAAQMFQPE